MPLLQQVPEVLQLLLGSRKDILGHPFQFSAAQHNRWKNFHQYIHAYNAAFAFVSLGYKKDDHIQGSGPPVFKIRGCQRFPYPDSFRPPSMTPRSSRCTRTLAPPSTAKTQPSATPPTPPRSSLQVPSHPTTPNPADLRTVARRHVVGELLVLSHKRWTLSVS